MINKELASIVPIKMTLWLRIRNTHTNCLLLRNYTLFKFMYVHEKQYMVGEARGERTGQCCKFHTCLALTPFTCSSPNRIFPLVKSSSQKKTFHPTQRAKQFYPTLSLIPSHASIFHDPDSIIHSTSPALTSVTRLIRIYSVH